MITGHVVAAQMVREATRQRLTEPPREPRLRRSRRRLAALSEATLKGVR
jgi:hypothetical protein